MEGLRKRRHRVLLAATSESQILDEAAKRGIPVTTIPMHRSQWPAAALTLRRLIREPVIASAVGCIPEMIRLGGTGRLIPPHDPEILAAVVIRHFNTPGPVAVMARAGRKLVEERYTLDVMLDRVEAFYERLLQVREACGSR